MQILVKKTITINGCKISKWGGASDRVNIQCLSQIDLAVTYYQHGTK